jgi:hypothetical protein
MFRSKRPGARRLAALLTACVASSATAQSDASRFTTDDGVSIHYRVAGSGATTVIVPMGIYLEEALSPLAKPGRRLVFYDPRHRGRSGRGDLAAVSLDRSLRDMDQLRAALGVEQVALIGWSGLGMKIPEVRFVAMPERDGRPAAWVTNHAGYARQSDQAFRRDGFFEREVHKVVRRYGNIAHVFSTYEFRATEDGPATGRGVNSLQLYRDGTRWWISNVVWDGERPGNPIPSELLP